MEELTQSDSVALREKIHKMQQDVESLEKKIARVTKAAKALQKAHAALNVAATEFQSSLLPFEKDGTTMISEFSRTLEKVNESEANLGERLGPMIIDALNKFLENEVRVGIELHGKMVRAREVFDKVARTKKKDGKAAEEIEERKREFEEANVRYVQKLIDVETKSNFELMDVFTTWMVCALTHHKRSYKVLDELQPKIKQYKKQMFKDARAYTAEEEVRTNIVKESLAKKGSQSEFQGYLTNQSVIGKPRRFWAVANGMLAQYRNYSDFSPIESFDLLLFTVKNVPDDQAAFCLVSPNENMILGAGSAEEKAQWMTAIAASISNQLNSQNANDSTSSRVNTKDAAHPLQRVRRGNSSFLRCADCGAPDPDWGAINLGILFCINCSGIHRNLGVHISQVRSLTLDVDVWDDDLIRMMTGIGNETSNSVWEALHVDSHVRPNPNSDMKLREAFILAKYRDKAFVDRISDDALNEGLLELCGPANEMPSVRDVMQFFVSGAQLDCVNGQNQSLAHLLAQHSDCLVSLEFVCRNGTPTSLVDDRGMTALDVAERAGNIKAAACLRRHANLPPIVNSPASIAIAPIVVSSTQLSPRSGIRPAPGLLRSSQVEVGSPKEEKRTRTWTSTKPRETVIGARMPLVRQHLESQPTSSFEALEEVKPAVSPIPPPKKPLPMPPRSTSPTPPPLPPDRRE